MLYLKIKNQPYLRLRQSNLNNRSIKWHRSGYSSNFCTTKRKSNLSLRNEEKLEALRQEIESNGGQASLIKTDVSSFEDTKKMVTATISKWGKIDILIANAGVYIKDVSHEINVESFQESLI